MCCVWVGRLPLLFETAYHVLQQDGRLAPPCLLPQPPSLLPPCRASLAVGAAPSLASAGASLAALFLEKGLDGGDAAVLQRLMALLVAPLAQWGAAPQVLAGWGCGALHPWGGKGTCLLCPMRGWVILTQPLPPAAVLQQWLKCALGSPPQCATCHRSSCMQNGWACVHVSPYWRPMPTVPCWRLRRLTVTVPPRGWCARHRARTTCCCWTAGWGEWWSAVPNRASLGCLPAEQLGCLLGSSWLKLPPVPESFILDHASQPSCRLLQDYVAVCTQPLEVHAGYQLRLCQPAATEPAAGEAEAAPDSSANGSGDASPTAVPGTPAVAGPTPAAVMEAVRPALARAWPSVLDAATGLLAEQPVAAAAGEAVAAREQHAALLDICQMALSRAAEAVVAASGSQQQPGQQQQPAPSAAAALATLSAALAALRRLSAQQFSAAGWLSGDAAQELSTELQQLLQSILLPATRGGLVAQTQAASLAEAAAAVLRQLPADAGVQQQVVAAAGACLQLAAGSSTAAVSDALAAVGKQLQQAAAAGPATFVPYLQQALQLGVEVATTSQQQEQLATAAAFLSDAAAAAALQEQQTLAESAELPPTDSVVVAALQALSQLAEQCSSGNRSGGGNARQLEAALAGMLALGGALRAAPQAASSSSAVAAVSAAEGCGDEDWEEDPFGDSSASAPAQEDSTATAAADTADAAQHAAEAGAGAEKAEWGDDPFTTAPPAAAAGAAEADVADGRTADSAAAEGAMAGLSLAGAGTISSSRPDGTSAVAAAGRQLVLDLLAATAGSHNPAVQLPALGALCIFLQQQQAAAAGEQLPGQQLAWALQCAAAALPGAFARVHALMGGSSGRLGETDTQVCKGEFCRL